MNHRNLICLVTILAAVCAPFSALPSYAQNEQAYAQARANFFSEFIPKKNDPNARVRVVNELNQAVYEKVEEDLASLLVNAIRTELGQKNEEQVSHSVLMACVEGLKKIKKPEIIKQILKYVSPKGQENWRVKFYIIQAFTAYPGDEVSDALIALIQDKFQSLRVAALDVVIARADKRALPAILKVLDEEPHLFWEVKVTMVKAIASFRDPSTVRSLMAALKQTRDDEGRVRDELMQAIKAISGIDPLADPKAFEAWLNPKAEPDPKAVGGGTTSFEKTPEPVNFFGVKTTSTRIVFIMDMSGSMMEPASEPPKQDRKEPPDTPLIDTKGKPIPPDPARAQARNEKEKYDKRVVRTRIDAVKKELINTLYVLDEKVHFTIIFYSTNVVVWEPAPVPATWQNKIRAMEKVDKQGALGGTNMWDAIEQAFQILPASQQKPADLGLQKKTDIVTAMGGADTLYVLTDGEPNLGRISNKPTMLEELRKINQLRKVIINTITVGSPGGRYPMDPGFMAQMAAENGGTAVHITQ